jgi:hypothetical protein
MGSVERRPLGCWSSGPFARGIAGRICGQAAGRELPDFGATMLGRERYGQYYDTPLPAHLTTPIYLLGVPIICPLVLLSARQK